MEQGSSNFIEDIIDKDIEAGCDKIDAAYEKGLLDKIFTTNLNYRPQSIIDRPWYAEVNMCKYVSYIIDTLNSDSSISELLNPVGPMPGNT